MIDVVLLKSSIPHIRGQFTAQDRVTFRLDRWVTGDNFVIVARGDVNGAEIGNPDAIGQVFAVNAAREWLAQTIREAGYQIPDLPLYVFFADESETFIRDWVALNPYKPDVQTMIPDTARLAALESEVAALRAREEYHQAEIDTLNARVEALERRSDPKYNPR